MKEILGYNGQYLATEDGLEFSNQAEAARYYGINPGALSRVLNGQRNHVHGLHFERM